MKIGQSGGHVPPPQGKVGLRTASPAGSTPRAATGPVGTPAGQALGPGSGPGTAISLSMLSTQLQSLELKMVDDGQFDAPRVAAIRQAIEAGEFRVNPEAIADKLIASVREMLAKPTGA